MSLSLENITFELNTKTRDTAFFIHDGTNGLEYMMDCTFREGAYDGCEITPYFCINSIETTAVTKEELVGISFSIHSIEEADEREDSFYVFEHEPLEQYHLQILEIKNEKARIHCRGTAIVDGYANPYVTKNFEIDCWLPIITNVSDWHKFNL